MHAALVLVYGFIFGLLSIVIPNTLATPLLILFISGAISLVVWIVKSTQKSDQKAEVAASVAAAAVAAAEDVKSRLQKIEDANLDALRRELDEAKRKAQS